VRTWSRVCLVLYVLTLLWLVLFKLSYDIPTILADHQTRSLNLIPFVTFGQTGLSETVSNVIIFIPFGLLLSVTLKGIALGRLLLGIAGFSLVCEALQYLWAIGTTDLTDVVTNTLGGLTGLLVYRLVALIVPVKILDGVITVLGLALFAAFLLLRLLVLRVRY
jgi:glycopeptide antibiotics resistance protein